MRYMGGWDRQQFDRADPLDIEEIVEMINESLPKE